MRELTKSWSFWFVILLIAIWWVVPAKSEESVLSEATVGVGGLICDTPDEVVSYITLAEGGASAQDALNGVPGCGILNRPMLMRVVAVMTHKGKSNDYLIVRYDFLNAPLPAQYGIGASKPRGTEI